MNFPAKGTHWQQTEGVAGPAGGHSRQHHLPASDFARLHSHVLGVPRGGPGSCSTWGPLLGQLKCLAKCKQQTPQFFCKRKFGNWYISWFLSWPEAGEQIFFLKVTFLRSWICLCLWGLADSRTRSLPPKQWPGWDASHMVPYQLCRWTHFSPPPCRTKCIKLRCLGCLWPYVIVGI